MCVVRLFSLLWRTRPLCRLSKGGLTGLSVCVPCHSCSASRLLPRCSRKFDRARRRGGNFWVRGWSGRVCFCAQTWPRPTVPASRSAPASLLLFDGHGQHFTVDLELKSAEQPGHYGYLTRRSGVCPQLCEATAARARFGESCALCLSLVSK